MNKNGCVFFCHSYLWDIYRSSWEIFQNIKSEPYFYEFFYRTDNEIDIYATYYEFACIMVIPEK